MEDGYECQEPELRVAKFQVSRNVKMESCQNYFGWEQTTIACI